MLIGQYSHTIDGKKRLSLPSKFRKELGKKVVITNGLDSCIFLYPEKEWKKVSEKLGELSIGQADLRNFNRFILSGAIETEVDQAGRILIPDFLKEFANLNEKVIVAGVQTRIEIWDEDIWKKNQNELRKKADTLAEKLGEIGMI